MFVFFFMLILFGLFRVRERVIDGEPEWRDRVSPPGSTSDTDCTFFESFLIFALK